MAKFTADRRSQLLLRLAAGETLRESCEAVGVTPRTVQAWAARGRSSEASENERSFAASLDAIRVARQPTELADGEAEKLLAVAARRGSVSALVELRRRGQQDPEAESDPDEDRPALDRLTAGHPRLLLAADDVFLGQEMALGGPRAAFLAAGLTEAEQGQSRALSDAAQHAYLAAQSGQGTHL